MPFCLIETWDVLKLTIPLTSTGYVRRLIETWDVLKSIYIMTAFMDPAV